MATGSRNKPNDILDDAPPEKFFWSRDGKVLKNLGDLAEALPDMNEESFNHHFSGEKNDFAEWVFRVHGDEVLAESLRDVSDKSEASRVIHKRIKELDSSGKGEKKSKKKGKKKKSRSSKERKDFIKKNYRAMPVRSIAEEIGLAESTVRKYASQMNLSKKKDKASSDTKVEEMGQEKEMIEGKEEKKDIKKEVKRRNEEYLREKGILERGACPKEYFLKCTSLHFFMGMVAGFLIGLFIALMI